MQDVLAIGVDDALLTRWRSWYAPAVQPFLVDHLPEELRSQVPSVGAPPADAASMQEWRDTFFLYGGERTWLDESQFASLPIRVQRALRAQRRLSMRPKPSPVWPSVLAGGGDMAMIRWVETGVHPSEHLLVRPGTWARSQTLLPAVQELAGTFSVTGSGANCFATVIAAVDGSAAAEEWTQTADFHAWLTRRTTPVSSTARDTEPGIVLAWAENGLLAHAAITIGDGWVLNKPSQSWSSPRLVWSVERMTRSWRYPGTRLSRHALT